MKKVSFNIKKCTARVLLALGTALGLSGCFLKHNPVEAAYGPPPGWNGPKIQVLDDVYGPPVVDSDSITEKAVIEPDSLSESEIMPENR